MTSLMNTWTIVLTVVVLGTVCVGYSGGPPVGKTGAPGESTCRDCHDDFALNSGSAAFSITAPPAATSGSLSLQVAFTGSNTPRHGFQITARDSSGNPAGTWSLPAPLLTQANGPDHVNHRLAGTTMTNWPVDWSPPSSLANGPLTFYAAGNEANGNGNDDGDFIYTTTTKVYRAALSTATTTWPIGTLQTINLSAPHVAGDGYALVASDSTQPTSLGGPFVAPVDGTTALAQLSLSLPSIFQDFVGSLDAQGQATARVLVPNLPSLSGMVAHLAYIAFDTSALPALVPTEVSHRLTVTVQ